MNLVFFTPAARCSAIGRMASLVVRELIARNHGVTVVRTEEHTDIESPAHAFETAVVRWDETQRVARLVQEADTVIYQVGNNYLFHRGCLEWLPSLPGVVCLHDYFLADLFRGWALTRRELASATLRSWYGEEVATSFFAYANSSDVLEGRQKTAPMTEWVAAMATGVVTHSSWDIQRVLRSCPGPVEVIPLAYDKPNVTPVAGSCSLAASAERSAREDGMRILVVGHVNANKRVDSVIRAISNSPRLQAGAILRLVGRIEPQVEAHLSTLARSLSVQLLISGEVDDATLAHAFEWADVACCLRLPALEAASASTIEAMLYGKPVIVMNTGFYRELPDECVCKVSPDHELGDLQEKLSFLAQNPTHRMELGDRAARWAAATFSVARYADCLVEFSIRAARAAPVIEAGRFFANTLESWGASEDNLPMQETLAPLRIFEQP